MLVTVPMTCEESVEDSAARTVPIVFTASGIFCVVVWTAWTPRTSSGVAEGSVFLEHAVRPANAKRTGTKQT